MSNQGSLTVTTRPCPGDWDSLPACLPSLALCHMSRQRKQQVGLRSSVSACEASRGTPHPGHTLSQTAVATGGDRGHGGRTAVTPDERLFRLLRHVIRPAEAGELLTRDISPGEDANPPSFTFTTFYRGEGMRGILVRAHKSPIFKYFRYEKSIKGQIRLFSQDPKISLFINIILLETAIASPFPSQVPATIREHRRAPVFCFLFFFFIVKVKTSC